MNSLRVVGFMIADFVMICYGNRIREEEDDVRKNRGSEVGAS